VSQPKKIFFLLPGLTFGGAERVIFTLCNELDRERFSPTLVLFNQEGHYLIIVSFFCAFTQIFGVGMRLRPKEDP